MALNNKDIIIIPDIHGRTFWKEAVKDNEDKTIVFLGDYLDPYPRENITNDMAWENFMEIISFKREHMDNVHLLIGNHDLGYINPDAPCSRKDIVHITRNKEFFLKNLSLFEMAYETTINGTRFLLSHAGVNRKWLLDYKWLFGGDKVKADWFNLALTHPDYRVSFLFTLCSVSYYRGGDDENGSMVWADIREFSNPSANLSDTVQIVGHTQVEEEFCLNGKIYDLDCRRAFVLDQEGNVSRLFMEA